MATFEWETRQEWGAKPPKNRRYDVSPEGTVVHYPGGGHYTGVPHSDCRARMRMWQQMHMTPRPGNPRGSNDIEYGLVLCEHLILMEARLERDRPNVRVGSNGTALANYKNSSIQLMRGSDDPRPPQEELFALSEAIVWQRAKGKWGPKITGHRDHVSTACPGGALYARLPDIRRLVKKIETGDDMPDVSLSRMQRLAKRALWSRGYGPEGREQVALIENALAAEKVTNYRGWQRSLGYKGGDADGIPGEVSLKKLGRRHGFRVTT